MQTTKELKKDFDKYNWLSWPLQTVLSRFSDMDGAISEMKADWDICDQQFEANTFEDPFTGELIINVNIEQQLQDYELGRTSADLVFDVKPSWYSVNTQNLEASKYILQSFIDKELFYEEYRNFKADKFKYGTGIWFTGLRFEVDYVKKIEKQKIWPEIWDWFFSKKYQEERRENRYFTPQNIPLRSFRIDDRVLYQSSFKKAEDCILIETLSQTQAKAKYWDIKEVDKEVLELPPVSDDSPAYWVPSAKWMMVLYHYYNKITKDYIIVVNRTWLLYEGKIVYKNWQLPFDVCQHYPNSWCIYGIGWCRRVRLWKAYKNNLAQSALRGTRLSSWKLIALWSGSESVDWDFYVPSWGIGIARLTGGIADMKDIDTRTDINGQIQMISIIDQEIRDATGIDIKSPYESNDETLWQTEIREQNKAIRYKSVDECMQLSLDRILTATLSNIQQFAPVLLSTKVEIKNKAWKVVETMMKFPTIQINNVFIEKKDWIQVITEDFGSYWYLELKPETTEWEITVNIVTPATNNLVMQTIWQNKFVELTTSMQSLANIYWPEVLQEEFPVDQIIDKFKSAYQIDRTKLSADTKKDLISRQNKKDIDDMQAMLQDMRSLSTQIPNDTTWQTPATPTEWGNAQIQSWGTWGAEQTAWIL